MNTQEQQLLLNLVRQHRWAALATCSVHQPEASWVAYVLSPDAGSFLFHLSTLALHTRNLLENPYASLAISESDPGHADPQTLARVSIQGKVAAIGSDSADYIDAVHCYQQRLPDAALRFQFSDFLLLRFVPARVRFVGGFARAYNLDAIQFQKILNAPAD
ncbi:MAG: pyridoxamine 5'-phosphate oxidase [Candidatus Contendobacter odensis]|uniref:Pyridoxamine 5'-phosphate oxidase n=1 Tax=Candidatus Contendibacter odensensis TaxID=1400860 RepID=A0A2G6PGN5_9GAMM|nr:MAG: pyridoxamine 5'-phosphate oxidase [Candidatus Contendobacter odensis]